VCTSGTVSEVRRWRHDATVSEKTQTISEAVRPAGITQKDTLIYFTRGTTVNTYEAGLDPVTAKGTTKAIRLNTGDEGKSMYPVWFDEGRMISYVTYPGTELLMRPYPKGTERRITTDLSSGIGGTAWMRDGTVIVAGFKRGFGQGYYRLNTESRKTEPIILQSQDTGELRGFPDLSHDETLLFYRDDQHHEIRVRNLKDSNEKVLYRATEPYPVIRSVHLSPDGQWLAFLIDNNAVRPAYDQLSASTNALMIVPTSGGPARQLYAATWPELILPVQSFAWMQDSRRILFVKGRGMKLGLWSLSIEGGQPKSAGLTIEGMRHLAVHPNGSKIAFAAGNEGTIHVRSFDLR
jgi:Tol biopolymer transport system component